MLSPIWLLFLIPGVVSPLESPLHISLTGSVRAFYLMNFSIAALAFLLIFGCIICGLPICCVRHLGPQQNMGHRATHGKEIQTEPAKIAGAPWKRFLLDPFLTIIFLRVPAEFVFRGFFSTCSTIMVFGSWSSPGEWDSQLPRLNLCRFFSSFVKTEKKLLVRPPKKLR